MEELAEQAVAAIDSSFGIHPNARAVHAKGVLAKGHFTASPAAAGLTTAAHMQGGEIPVTVRFSSAGTDPTVPDYAKEVHGFAVKFYLPDDSRTDIVGITLPCFLVRTPEEFVAFTKAQKLVRGKPGPRALLYLATHPQSWRGARAALATKAPESLVTLRFNGIHAFKWIAPDGTERHVRYSWLPEAGERSIGDAEAKAGGRDYLTTELSERLAAAPARFTLQVQIAGPEDPTHDATAVWPDDRETVEVGTLELTGIETGREQGDDVLVFDPARMTPGIELSDDPLPAFRSLAYSVSVKRRTGADRPEKLA